MLEGTVSFLCLFFFFSFFFFLPLTPSFLWVRTKGLSAHLDQPDHLCSFNVLRISFGQNLHILSPCLKEKDSKDPDIHPFSSQQQRNASFSPSLACCLFLFLSLCSNLRSRAKASFAPNSRFRPPRLRRLLCRSTRNISLFARPSARLDLGFRSIFPLESLPKCLLPQRWVPWA